MDNEKNFSNVAAMGRKVMVKIVIFLLFYIAIIAAGIGVFYSAWLFSLFIWNTFIPTFDIHHTRQAIILTFMLIGFWLFAFTLGFYLLKPLFSFTNINRENLREITATECPELFAMIERLVEKVGCASPKHVYLSSETNAYVFYDTNFWSIFFPIKKNLQIGLGLLQSMSVTELEAVLAHEFGHFSQKSMKIDSTIVVLNTIICNLIFTDDKFDRLINKWRRLPINSLSFFGKIVYHITNFIRYLNKKAYRMVQKDYYSFSQETEFDADYIAYTTIGSAAFISEHCKINVNSKRQNLYEKFIVNFCREEGKIINDYWRGYNEVILKIEKIDNISLKTDILLEKPILTASDIPSNVEFKNLWSTHPSLEERLYRARLANVQSNINNSSAVPLIPLNIRNEVGEIRLKEIAGAIFDKQPEQSSMDDFLQWINDEIEQYFLPIAAQAYFDRRITPFSLPEELSPDMPQNPFTSENRQILLAFEGAKDDEQLLSAIAEGKTVIEEFRYKGILYTKNNVPLEEHQKYVEFLEKKAAHIDYTIGIFLFANSKDKDSIIVIYYTLFYIEDFYASYAELFDKANYLRDMLNEMKDKIKKDELFDKEKEDILSQTAVDCDEMLREFISSFRWDLVNTIFDDNFIENVKNYNKSGFGSEEYIEIENIYAMIAMLHKLRTVYSIIAKHCRRFLAKTALPYINE